MANQALRQQIDAMRPAGAPRPAPSASQSSAKAATMPHASFKRAAPGAHLHGSVRAGPIRQHRSQHTLPTVSMTANGASQSRISGECKIWMHARTRTRAVLVTRLAVVNELR